MNFFRPAALCTSMAIGLAAFGAPALAGGEAAPSTMTIQAEGTATASPDQAVIQLGVENTGSTAREAMAGNTAAMTAVFESMTGLGIPASDISTSGLSLNPRYDRRSEKEPRILGYQVSNQVAVTVHDIDGLGAVLDALVGAGANQIRSVSFEISDTSDLEQEARISAAKAARAKAEAYADALGTDILGILSISEGHVATPRPYEMAPMRAMAMDAGGAVPVSASDIDVSVNLNVVFELSGALD